MCDVAVRCEDDLTSCSLILQMLRNCLRQLTPEEGEAEGQGERDGEEEGTAGSEGEGVLCPLMTVHLSCSIVTVWITAALSPFSCPKAPEPGGKDSCNA